VPPAATPATVADLLGSLELGQPNEELALGGALRAFYELGPDDDLTTALADRPVHEVLGVLVSAAEPFAALVVAVFDFPADSTLASRATSRPCSLRTRQRPSGSTWPGSIATNATPSYGPPDASIWKRC
jgi:hypothetical protein